MYPFFVLGNNLNHQEINAFKENMYNLQVCAVNESS